VKNELVILEEFEVNKELAIEEEFDVENPLEAQDDVDVCGSTVVVLPSVTSAGVADIFDNVSPFFSFFFSFFFFLFFSFSSEGDMIKPSPSRRTGARNGSPVIIVDRVASSKEVFRPSAPFFW
jgi:hypothetical protein